MRALRAQRHNVRLLFSCNVRARIARPLSEFAKFRIYPFGIKKFFFPDGGKKNFLETTQAKNGQLARKPLPTISVEAVMTMKACGSFAWMKRRSASACARVRTVMIIVLRSWWNAP